MAGTVTVTFKTTASTEDEVRELLGRAQAEIDGGYYFHEGQIGHINLISFDVTETVTLTRAELDALVKEAVDKAIAGSNARPSMFDDGE